ncbi:MAG TPA: hypothetical protein VE843_03700, partial [Ktedonobacteraceae bacterium]|nr:hypothetical protein [Ktedonobacteraceae bacterium]
GCKGSMSWEQHGVRSMKTPMRGGTVATPHPAVHTVPQTASMKAHPAALHSVLYPALQRRCRV